MSQYDGRPWLAAYPPGVPSDLAPEHSDALEMFRSAVARAPERTCISRLA